MSTEDRFALTTYGAATLNPDRNKLSELIWDFKHLAVLHALSVTGGNRTRAAKLLGIQRTYLCRLARVQAERRRNPVG